jgi:hypothetical protein
MDGFEQGPWTLRPGTTSRGGASCNLTERILEVPLGADATSRVVRAHELMHIRVSPHQGARSTHCDEVSARALECAEEFRVNTLLADLGFATTLLRDGTEKSGARRLAEEGDWREAVCFLLAVVTTGAERDYLAGIRSAQPTWVAGLRAVKKRAVKIMVEIGVDVVASTELDADGVPLGYLRGTVAVAKMIDLASRAMAPVGPEALRQFRRSLEPGGRRAPSGHFASLVFDESLAGAHRPRSASLRRPAASVSGTVLRYPGRLLTDHQFRAFGAKKWSHGGIVVIDQSGSMDIGLDDVAKLLRCAPDADIVGYSHRPGDLGSTPNAWMLASRGTVVRGAPVGNVGNGVDGPVLRWAVARSSARGPIVWVTDGQVTDSNDHPNEFLSEECAILVRKYRIRMVRDLGDAGRALRCHRPLVPLNFGRVGRKLLEIRGFST